MNKKLIFIFIVMSVFLMGCELGNITRPITDVDIRTGINGLTMEFAQNAPPGRVFENDAFPMAIKLKNKGAFDIGDNKNTPDIKEGGVLVFGFEKAYVDFTEKEKNDMGDVKNIPFDIKGRSIYNPAGDDEFITVNAQAKKIGAQSETHRSTILATACYPYKTVFGGSVCIDTDIYGMVKRQKACTVRDWVFSEGQGAPVAVTKIETRMLPDTSKSDVDRVKPHFMIYIKNRGNGEVIKLDKIEAACSRESLDYTDFNAVIVNVSLSDEELNCSVNGENPKPTVVRLRDKEDIIRCTYDKGVDGSIDAYTAPLRIDLDYGYTFTISKDIIIEKILTH